MQLSIKSRLLKLEQSKPKRHTCFTLDYFYGRDATPVPLTPNLSLSNFYNQYGKTNGEPTIQN